jgi:predicted RNA-binding Zn-ribbon protein involved in translation (DUF1610 family)
MKWFRRVRKQESSVCPTCGEEQKLAIVSLLRGSRGDIEVFFTHLPTLYCGQPGHPRRFPGQDFGARLIDAVFWQKEIPLAQPAVWAKIKCIQCGRGIAKEPAYPGEVGGLLKIQDLPSFGIRIKAPLVSCPRCGTEQIQATTDVSGAVSGSFIVAFNKIELGP